MARYETGAWDGGWIDTTKPVGKAATDAEQCFECVESYDVIEYMSTLEARVAALEGLLQKLSYDHECCDSENCRFCIAVDALAAKEKSSG